MDDRELAMQFYQPKYELTEETLNRITAEFVQEADVMSSSRALYKKSIKWFVSWLVEKGITLPTRSDIVQWKNEMQKTLKPRTVNVRLATAKAFFAWAESKFYYPNIAVKVKKLPIAADTYAKEALSDRKLGILLRSVHRSTVIDKRDYALILLGSRTAMRTVEMGEVNIGDIRVYEGIDNPSVAALLWLRKKGHIAKDRYVVLTKEVVNAIGDYLQARTARGEELTPETPMFIAESMKFFGERLTTQGVRKAIAGRMKYALPKSDKGKICPHSLRHTGITMALKAGASLQDVQAMAGHRMISTTMIYAQNLERVKNSAEVKMAKYLQTVPEAPTKIQKERKLLNADNPSFNEPVNLDPEELSQMLHDMATGKLPENEKEYVKKYLSQFIKTY